MSHAAKRFHKARREVAAVPEARVYEFCRFVVTDERARERVGNALLHGNESVESATEYAHGRYCRERKASRNFTPAAVVCRTLVNACLDERPASGVVAGWAAAFYDLTVAWNDLGETEEILCGSTWEVAEPLEALLAFLRALCGGGASR